MNTSTWRFNGEFGFEGEFLWSQISGYTISDARRVLDVRLNSGQVIRIHSGVESTDQFIRLWREYLSQATLETVK